MLTCDMRDGNVAIVNPNQENSPPMVLTRLNNPCHVETCDLDSNGTIDLVVGDLGSSVPYDHRLGRVVWLRPDKQPNTYEPIVVASGLGRIADVRPGDMDGDGDVDLVVAEFGLHRTGQVLLLQNAPGSGDIPEFRPRQIDPRPGAIHVPIVDLNGDGRLDFLGLISQEYECVEAYMNQETAAFMGGGPSFARERLWTGPDLTFGSSGIEPVDLDQDGDVDVLYTNGDSFDNNYANPSHGIQWLENLDNHRFLYHRLADFTGACRALAGDIDLDGDLDIVATAWLPEKVKPASLRARPLASVVCLEQTAPGVFERHTLEAGAPRYAALELADFDGDGDLDFAVGSNMASLPHGSHWLAVWRNQLR
ncbi:MAG: FG-GAP repeat domain-containing protein [Thermoguttaceae bacterium]